MEKPIAIANYFIKKSLETGVPVTPMKLVKLVYIAHGWHLGLTGEPLLSEAVQAWQYGPVIRSIYVEFKKYGNSPITALEVDDETYSTPITDNPTTTEFLDKIWELYSDITAAQLSTMTHIVGTPWYKIWEGDGGKHVKGAIIPNYIIKDHYLAKVKVPINDAAH